MTAPTEGAMRAARAVIRDLIERSESEYLHKYWSFVTSNSAAIIDREMGQWQDIATAPKDETRVMLWNPTWSFPQPAKWVAYRNAGKGAWVLDAGFKITQQFPTHWLHIPQIPPPPCPETTEP